MRMLTLEERVEALEVALGAVLLAEALGADDDGVDSMASNGLLLLQEQDRLEPIEPGDGRRRRILGAATQFLSEPGLEPAQTVRPRGTGSSD